MRILGLAKEVGIPYERLLLWCLEAGLSYSQPEEEVSPEDARRIRAAFLGERKRLPTPFPLDEEEALSDGWLRDEDLKAEGFPQNIEELEALERDLYARPFAPKQKPKAKDRVLLKDLLSSLGIENRTVVKKIRKLLPEHVSRLFNREDLSEDQAAALKTAIEEKVGLCCGDPACRSLLEDRFGKKAIFPTRLPAACRLCGGSAIHRGMELLASACEKEGIRRILVVGGSPASHNELNEHRPVGLEFRLVEGDISRDKQRAAADLKWCDIAVIWAGTILGHQVSQNYLKSGYAGSVPILTVNRRSVEALCDTLAQYLEKKAERG